jgi:hypothetical protein
MGQLKNALLNRLENDANFFETYWLAEENHHSDPEYGPGQLDSLIPKPHHQSSQPSFDEPPF